MASVGSGAAASGDGVRVGFEAAVVVAMVLLFFAGGAARKGMRPRLGPSSQKWITNIISITPALSITIRAVATRMTREQSRATTRERLLAGARRVFAARGYHGASVEEIASEAGYSTGALYSNFDGKEDLFLALMEYEIARNVREIEEAVGRQATIPERARGGAAQWMAFVEREPELVLLFVEFWTFAVRDPRVRPQVARRLAEVREMITRLIARAAAEFDLELALPAEQLAIAVDALADGIARQKLADPQAVPDELLGSTLSLLFAAATRPRAG
jgi:AcrR family transcriptional regulator